MRTTTHERLQRIRRRLPELEVEGLLVVGAENRRYLSGFRGSAGALLITPARAILATDFRYWEQAEREAPAYELFRYEGSGALSQHFAEIVELAGVRRIGFEARQVTVAAYEDLLQAAPEAVELVPLGEVVEEIRQVKTADEIAELERAIALTDAAYEHAVSVVRPGMTERELAWEIDGFQRRQGAEAEAFPTIVAAGPNGALPHAQPTARPIASGEPIVLDFGARLASGYNSDLTRTICLGQPDGRLIEVYGIVRRAEEAAIATIRPGITSGEIDAAGRDVIAAAGYGEYFGHAIGHGIGLAVHEAPFIRHQTTEVIREGMVFTIEPGIYLPGWGGVRIEDVVVVEGDRARVLSRAPKGLGSSESSS